MLVLETEKNEFLSKSEIIHTADDRSNFPTDPEKKEISAMVLHARPW